MNMETNNTEEYGTSELNRNGMTFMVGQTSDVVAADPWEKAAEKYPVGTKLHGKVVNFKPYGFFVETDQGFFGLVHGSQIAGWNWKDRFDETFSLGQEVEVEVTKVDPEAHRMAFAYAMPAGGAAAAEPADEPEDEPLPPTFSEVARQWTEENAEASAKAFDWLKAELEDGPLYGPLASVLSDKFDVPVPVSFWIRQFPEFACFSGRGDNPSDLPAVALGEHAGDVAYWKRFKAKASDLTEARSQAAGDAVRFGALALRLNERAFPGSAWIAAYKKTTDALLTAGETYGVGDTVERLVVPLMAELGWAVGGDRSGEATMVRGDRSAFSLRFAVGEEGRPAVAIVCDRVGTAFREQRNVGTDPQSLSGRNVVERVLALANQLRGLDADTTRVVWTDAHEWVVFSKDALAQRVGILSDRRGEQILDETRESDDNGWFRRIVLPVSGSAFDWLEAFADLQDCLGRDKF